MRFMLSIVSFIVSSSLIAGQALACIGDGSSFAVGFRESEKPGELIAIVNRQKPGSSDNVTEILDDTGYVSMHLALVEMVKRAEKDGTKTISGSDPTYKFFKDRFYHFQKYAKENFRDPLDNRVPFSTTVLQNTMASETAITPDSLIGGIEAINEALRNSDVHVMAATRKKASDPFGEEVDINDLGLPTWMKMRSISCNAGIGLFNAVPAKKAGGSQPKRNAGKNTTK